mmetsp:Transcript_96746/g.300853  ORF Transcript_96746/g.300853 Transcript_96746/m.300853 type:complete len:323 (+) Transcript_96746:166-1134(+)
MGSRRGNYTFRQSPLCSHLAMAPLHGKRPSPPPASGVAAHYAGQKEARRLREVHSIIATCVQFLVDCRCRHSFSSASGLRSICLRKQRLGSPDGLGVALKLLGQECALALLTAFQARGLSLCVKLRPDPLLLVPLGLEALSVAYSELLCAVEAVDGDAEVAAALHEEVVLIVSAIELHAPASYGMPAHPLGVTLVLVPVHRRRELLCLDSTSPEHAPDGPGGQEGDGQGLVVVRLGLVVRLLQLDDAPSRAPALRHTLHGEGPGAARHVAGKATAELPAQGHRPSHLLLQQGRNRGPCLGRAAADAGPKHGAAVPLCSGACL